MASIGEFDETLMELNDTEIIVFYLSTIINVIVLLNALIALTGKTFDYIYESTEAKGYREKVIQMSLL